MGFQDRDYNRVGDGGAFMARRRAGIQWPGGSVVTRLIMINAVVFLWDHIMAGSSRGGGLAISPWAWFTVEKGIHGFQLWRWITYQFVHADFGHIFFNMLGLFFFGPIIERWWGSRRFLAFYLLCGVSGAVVAVVLGNIPGLMYFEPQTIVVGASGSLFGVLAACAVLYPHRRVMLLFPPIPMSMRTLAMVFLGLAALHIIAGGQNAGGEAAHLGGAALGFYLVRHPRRLDWAERRRTHSASGRGRWQKKQETTQRESEEVDRILMKVKKQGVHGLSDAEQRTLQRATQRKRDVG